MKCIECGTENKPSAIECINCGEPLSVNVIPHKKGNHIDIDEIKPENNNNYDDLKKIVTKVAFAISLVLLLFTPTIVSYFLNIYSNDEIMKKYNEFLNEPGLNIIYIGNDQNTESDDIKKYTDNYDFGYLYIDTKDTSLRQEKKIRKELSIKSLSSTVIILQDGNVVDYLTDYKSEEKLKIFLQGHNIIPDDFYKTETIISKYNNLITSDEMTVVHIPLINDSDVSELIKQTCVENSINYQMIEGYLLAPSQLLKISNQLGFSENKENLLVLVRDGSIVTTLDKTYSSINEYFEVFFNYGIIDLTAESSLTHIDINKYNELLMDDDKKVIVVGEQECKYCEKLRPTLGSISRQYNFPIYYIDATNDIMQIETSLTNIGNTDVTITLPITMIIEKQKVLSYIIGSQSKEYYVDTFTLLGIIR